ncbi:MAG TPA: outer membrane lipoprotein chaperone LolA [Terriglobales bacterium]|nr:outer membrane lipoprotein chaperone LolA [Terriglobales bacterium]
MKSPSTLLQVLCVVLSAVLASAASLPDVHALAQSVDQHYNHLRSLQADFTETYRGNGMDRTESGTLWLKKPGKMRWEYRSPKEKLFLSDGHDAWFYVPGDRQVRKIAMKNLDDLRSPLALLLGKTQLEKELQGLSVAPDVPPLSPGDIVLRGVPKAMADRVSQVLLEISPDSRIVRITLEGQDGAVTEYRFTGQEDNVNISDQRFKFVPPPDAEVVEGEFAE